jgi:hypothetical protein
MTRFRHGWSKGLSGNREDCTGIKARERWSQAALKEKLIFRVDVITGHRGHRLGLWSSETQQRPTGAADPARAPGKWVVDVAALIEAIECAAIVRVQPQAELDPLGWFEDSGS